MSRVFASAVLLWIALGDPVAAAAAPTAVATYLFQDTANRFETASVLGAPRRVFFLDGNGSPPAQQAGLSLDATGLVDGSSYSVELVIRFAATSGWRRILDVQDRSSDNGFYVDPGDHLNVFPVAGGSAPFTTGGFRHVVLTNTAGVVKAYLDGAPQFTSTTNVMNVANSRNAAHVFLDNTAGRPEIVFRPTGHLTRNFLRADPGARRVRVASMVILGKERVVMGI